MRTVCEALSCICCGICPNLKGRIAPISSPPPPPPPPPEPIHAVADQPVVPPLPPPNPPPPPQNANQRNVNVRPQIRGQKRVINGIHPDPPTVWQGAA